MSRNFKLTFATDLRDQTRHLKISDRSIVTQKTGKKKIGFSFSHKYQIELIKAFKDITTRILLRCPVLKNHCRRGSSSFPLLHLGASVILRLATNEAPHEGLPSIWTMNLKIVQKHKTKGNSIFRCLALLWVSFETECEF